MSARVGIDLRGDDLYTASVGEVDGRMQILWLARAPRSEQISYPENALLSVAVPDHLVMVKQYQMRNGAGPDIELRLQFEMEQSLLEESSLFAFDSLRTGLTDRHLGLIYRRHRLNSLADSVGMSLDPTSRNFLARSAALGQGYTAFCRMSGGELHGLIDLGETELSLCLLYRGEITLLGHLKLDRYDATSESSIRRLAMEIKTLVSFKLASLAEMGLTLPMSRLTLSGELPDALVDQLTRYFPTGLGKAEINPSFLSDSVDTSQRPELYLPALGMAVI